MAGAQVPRVAIVTGAGGEIGRASAIALAADGACVVAADVDDGRTRATVAAVEKQGGRAVALTLDVADPGSWTNAVERTVQDLGRLDVLVNNAAATHLYAGDSDVERIDLDLWDEVMRVNLRGTMLGCRSVVPAMRAGGGGSIVNISSTRAVAGADDLVAYGVSKGAVDTLTRYVATAYAGDGIRCNAIRPGMVGTSAALDLHSTGPDLRRHALTGGYASVDDIAAAVAYLASPRSGAVTGHHLVVDGGLLAHQPYWTRDPA